MSFVCWGGGADIPNPILGLYAAYRLINQYLIFTSNGIPPAYSVELIAKNYRKGDLFWSIKSIDSGFLMETNFVVPKSMRGNKWGNILNNLSLKPSIYAGSKASFERFHRP